MNKLVLNDGTEIIDGFASRSSRNQLMVRTPGSDLAKAAVIFSNPEKTRQIICYYSIYKTTYIGYTDMYSIQHFESEGYIEVWIKPEEGTEPSYSQELTVPQEYVPMEQPQEAVSENA